MIENGIYYAPSSYEAGFISASHSNADIEFTVEAAKNIFKKIKESDN